MTLYDVGLFVHIVGALVLFAATGLEWVGILNLRSAKTAEEASNTSNMLRVLSRAYPLSGATLSLSGIYLTVTAWGWVWWIVVSLAAVIFLAATGERHTGRRLAAIGKMAAEAKGAVPEELSRAIRDPFLLGIHQVRTAFSLGIVFLMVAKPGLAGTLATLAVSLVLGWISTVPVRRRGVPRGTQASSIR